MYYNVTLYLSLLIFCLDVSVSNPLSTLSSTLHLSVLQPSAHSLVLSVLHGPLAVPSCIPSPQMHSNSVTVEAAYLDHPVTLQAYMRDGLAVEFFWWFTAKEKDKNMEGVKTTCLPNTDCLNSTVVSRAEKVARLCDADVSQNQMFTEFRVEVPSF